MDLQPEVRPVMMASTLIVIPAYNEETNIGDVLARLGKNVPQFDRLVVDDGSEDGTASVVDRLGERVVRLPCNSGYGSALQVGLRFALAMGYDTVVFFDADGQHESGVVPRLVEALEREGADMVVGSRFLGGEYHGPLLRRLTQRAFSLLTRLLLGQRIYDTTSGLKAIRSRAFDSLVAGNLLDFHSEALVRLGACGYRIVEVAVASRPREQGRSMYTPLRSLEYPIVTLVLIVIAFVDAWVERRAR